jgi:DNA repair exonuclease SbcCD ATPase subunit
MLMTIDPCEDLIVEVESLQQGIQNAEGALKQLANAHGGEPTAQDEQEMEQTRQALFKLRARLKDAEDQLKQCRERIRPVGAERL